MLTTVITAVVAGLAYWQFRKLVQTSRSDFIYKLRKDFFTDEARRLIFLIEHKLLEFRRAPICYFQIINAQEGDTYLGWCREDGNEDVYDNFQQLYERLEREGPRIREKKARRARAARS
jgi:hypothetical protein